MAKIKSKNYHQASNVSATQKGVRKEKISPKVSCLTIKIIEILKYADKVIELERLHSLERPYFNIVLQVQSIPGCLTNPIYIELQLWLSFSIF